MRLATCYLIVSKWTSAEHVLGAYAFASPLLIILFAILIRLHVYTQIHNRVHTLTCPIRDGLSCCKIRSR